MIGFLLKPRRMLVLGIGFLLGSRAGRAPWEKAMGIASQAQSKAQDRFSSGSTGTSLSSPASNGVSTDLRQTSGAMTQL